MKKIISLLTLPLAAVMALDFTMTEQGLFADTTTQTPASTTIQTPASTTASEASSSHLEPVNIPAYDSSNPSHLLITVANNKWTSTNLNSATYKHFYIEPGDYSGTHITLTADGTSGDRRSISLHNGNDTHPAALTDGDQANVIIKWDNASYWDIDRLSQIDGPANILYWLINGSSHNVINRFHLKNFWYGITIRPDSNYNTIQNSYINHMTHAGRMSDSVGIALSAGYAVSNETIIGTKIINNDIRNSGDGVQLVVSGGATGVYYPDTVIDGNNIWLDGYAYTNGDYSSNGYSNDDSSDYQIAENAMDFKAGSNSASTPVVVTNNIMWGYRKSDPIFSTGSGSCFVIHKTSKYVNFDRNIMFDSIKVGGGTPSKYGKFNNNIIYDVGHNNPTDDDLTLFSMYGSIDVECENNTLVDLGMDRYVRFTNTSGMTWSNNVNIDVDSYGYDDADTFADGNYYYNSPHMFPTDGTNHIETVPAMDDYSFQYERFTSSPKTKTLNGVITTTASPHHGVAGSNITNE